MGVKVSFNFISRWVCLLMLTCSIWTCHAQDWPQKPIRLVVPYPAGGGVDAAARLVAQHLTTVLGQPVLVETKPGGGTVIGTEWVSRAAPDGYTLLLTGGSTMSLLPLTYSGKLPFDPLNDLAPVSMISRMPFFVVASSATPYQSLRDVMVDAKAKVGRLSYASNGTGSISHLASVMLTGNAGADMIHIPYQGFSPAISDLVTGRVVMVISDLAPVKPHIQTGALRALAVASAQRSRFMPEIPTLAESGFPGGEFEIWLALYAPSKTPAAIVSRLHQELKKFLELPATREAFGKLGHESDGAGPDMIRQRIESEAKMLLPLVKSAGLYNK